MNTKNIYYLTASNLVLRVVAQGLLPLYPLLIPQNPISKLWTGYFMAGIYAFSFLGNWCSGFLLHKGFPLKRIVTFTYLPAIIGIASMGFQDNYLSLFFCTAFASFFNCVNLNISTIILGANSNDGNIMKNFAWIGVSSIMATLLGGLIVGPTLHAFGNQNAFIGFAVLIGCSSVFSLLLKEIPLHHDPEKKQQFVYKKNFVLLLISMFLLAMLIHFFKISLSLKMKELGYNISQISIFSTFGTIIVVPLPFVLSYLNKKFHAKSLLFSTHLATMSAFILLYFFSKDFTFVVAMTCISYMSYCARTPLMKLLHAMFDTNHFPKAQTIYGSLTWISAIAGYLLAGFLLEHSNFETVFAIGASLALLSVSILKFGVKINP